jgi:hypothetical protein
LWTEKMGLNTSNSSRSFWLRVLTAEPSPQAVSQSRESPA